MNKMLATNFLPYHCCFSAADDNMEKNIYQGIYQLTSLTIKPQVSKRLPKNQSRYTYYIKTFFTVYRSRSHIPGF